MRILLALTLAALVTCQAVGQTPVVPVPPIVVVPVPVAPVTPVPVIPVAPAPIVGIGITTPGVSIGWFRPWWEHHRPAPRHRR